MRKWIIGALVVLALLAWGAVVWFALPLVGFGTVRPFEPPWVRLLLIAVVWLPVAVIYLIRAIRTRRAARALEAALTEQQVTGDGEVLGDRMGEALAVLRKSSGSRAFLYELPWYVIIGPPGAGKTTALLNSGVNFPLAEGGQGAVAGVGGTRYCDWWFSEEAVLIDTAGRYTTQDSDAEADRDSWLSFLRLLKTHRANQPINGVILAISLQEIMTATPAEIETHAETVRNRLREIHEELRVDFPVYVLFTKADLISGFMEYFGSFSATRREKVWGHTFQTASKKEPTVERFAAEYDALVARLSEEVTDRLQEEPDGINRIAIFGFPGQVAMLRDRLGGFMGSVFGHSRYKVAANLRGFYFSSGTQEGTPIDQVLGAMERGSGGAIAGAQMSGKGRSFFLHDLLKRVIFPEAGWVSTDRRAVRRAAGLRYGAFALIGLACAAMLGLWGYSYVQNRTLIRSAEAGITDYEMNARSELERSEVDSIDLLEVSSHLQQLREMPTGYGDTQAGAASWQEGFGLSQRARLESAATTTYRQALERMFRSRLILRLERQLEDFVRGNEVLAIYETLKAYKLLGDAAPKSDDPFIIQWFRDDWRRNLYPGPIHAAAREELEAHLIAMLDLDAAKEPSFELNGALIDQAERALARMNIADQAYSLILSTVEFAPIEPFSVAYRAGTDADMVFETVDGAALADQVIPALYTYAGFHDFFLPQLSEIADKLVTEQWVMGDYAAEAQIEDEMQRVGPQLITRYTQDWIRAWEAVLGNIKLRPMAADKPTYRALAAASAPRTSPLLNLAEQIVAETRLTQGFTEEADPPSSGADAASGVAEEVAGQFGTRVASSIISRQQGMLRIGLDVAMGQAKNSQRAGVAGGASRRMPGAEIEQHFRDWENLVTGDIGTRLIDRLLDALNNMQRVLILAGDFPEKVENEMAQLLGTLKQASSRLPDEYRRMVEEAIEDFEGDAANASLSRLNEVLNGQVTQACVALMGQAYPFADSQRDMPIADFAKLFAPNGVIDRFFLQEMSPLVDITPAGWTWKEGGPLGGKLSANTLKQFERAAAIRDAFFPVGAMPQVDMNVAVRAMHPLVKTHTMHVNGQNLEFSAGINTPQVLSWPSSMAGGMVLLEVRPRASNREDELQIQGPWALRRLIMGSRPRVSGPTVSFSAQVGGRNVDYRIDSAGAQNPLLMRELTEFTCPTGL